uniref:Uncharacterized protein n=1 Tax=Arundo donax TaxID=35708 RepID=A0A0A9E524_ARUDO
MLWVGRLGFDLRKWKCSKGGLNLKPHLPGAMMGREVQSTKREGGRLTSACFIHGRRLSLHKAGQMQ